jgi:hypothetical protein
LYWQRRPVTSPLFSLPQVVVTLRKANEQAESRFGRLNLTR